MKEQSELQPIIADILQAKSILVIAHYNPDADAYGSSCGLSLGLQAIGKQVICVNESPLVDRYRFIPGTAQVQSTLPELSGIDLVIACDCGDIARTGDSFKSKIAAVSKSINIDHHKSNTFFGRLNWVLPEASSTSEMIFHLLEVLEKSTSKKIIDGNIATALYSGLSADTGSFRYSSTTANTLHVAQRLIEHGAGPDVIAQSLYGSERLEAVRLQAEALMNLKILEHGKLALVIVPREMLEKYQADADDTEALVERSRDIAGVEVAALIRQDDDLWKVSLRSKSAAHDVALVAQRFGGGGHKAAAGFRWRNSRADLESALLSELHNLLASR